MLYSVSATEVMATLMAAPLSDCCLLMCGLTDGLRTFAVMYDISAVFCSVAVIIYTCRYLLQIVTFTIGHSISTQ